MKKLYSFYLDCGRMGDLSGIFVADEDDVARIEGKRVNFGEVLGKHSDVNVKFEAAETLSVLTDDQSFISKFEELKCESGYNPLKYIYDE